MKIRKCMLFLVAGFLLAAPFSAYADEDLQKKLVDPTADLITLPFQYSGTTNVGPLERPQHTMNIQPVYPTRVGEWKIINRAIIPLLSNPAFTPAQDRKSGLGDTTYQGFIAPAQLKGKTIWGMGPAFLFPTASNERLGGEKWAAGPTAVALQNIKNVSVGSLFTQMWSFAGDDDREDVNQLQIQPIVSYRINKVYSLGYIGILVLNWNERSGEKWTIPIGVALNILKKPAHFVPMNFVIGGGKNVVRPDNAGDWFGRFQVNFILPK